MVLSPAGTVVKKKANSAVGEILKRYSASGLFSRAVSIPSSAHRQL